MNKWKTVSQTFDLARTATGSGERAPDAYIIKQPSETKEYYVSPEMYADMDSQGLLFDEFKPPLRIPVSIYQAIGYPLTLEDEVVKLLIERDKFANDLTPPRQSNKRWRISHILVAHAMLHYGGNDGRLEKLIDRMGDSTTERMGLGYVVEDLESKSQSHFISSDMFIRLRDQDLLDTTKDQYINLYISGTPMGMEDDYISQFLTNARPSWDEYFMATAQLMATRSTCNRLHVGCVLVKDNHIVAEGYNGSISGHPHCDEVGHLMHAGGCKRTIHAEKNALNMCIKFGIPSAGTTAYVTHYPCPDCMKELNQAGVKEIIYGSFYEHRYPNNFDTNMTLREFEGRKLEFSWN